jgi:DNA-binding SARP family transcriptional activator
MIAEHLRRGPSVDAPSMTRVDAARLNLIGAFELFVSGRLVSIPLGVQRVIAFVALQGRTVARSFVVGNLWPEASEERARANLRSALWRLRRLENEVLVADAAAIQLARHVRLDTAEVMNPSVASPKPLSPSRRLPPMYSGELLPGWYDDWVVMARERIRFTQLRALEDIAERSCADGRLAEAEEAYRAAADLEPFKETVQRGLIKVLLQAGSPGEAIHRYRAYRMLLHEELGVEPSPQMEAILEGVTAE